MALEEYKKKRNFKNSPEPTGGTPIDKKLYFVVQKHHASHLHYDFRLELRGILKSWAVPKGPSMDPSVKRLAMLVEDHPWDYRDFEGIIPDHQYGAGTVIVWDNGTYITTAITNKNKKEQEHSITSQFWKGEILLTFRGHKLKGTFKIYRAKDKASNAWYIVKLNDQYSTSIDITKMDKSILSKKTFEEVAVNPERQWQSNKPAYNKKSSKKLPEEASGVHFIIKKGMKEAMATSVKPMLCTLIKKPFNDPEWLYEVKWDGYRMLAFIKGGNVVLKSRGDQNYTNKYSAVATALQETSYDAVIDGEVVVLDENGNPDFAALQNYKHSDPIAFYVFDLIWCDGYNLMSLPLVVRKGILKLIMPQSDIVKYSESFDDGLGLFESAKRLGIEGIVAKKKSSMYTPGRKGDNWYKAKLSQRQEYIIGGWTESDNGRQFRSVLFGHYVNNQFMYVHHSGGGFTEKQLKELAAKLKKLEIDQSPFANKVDIKAKKHWVKPELVAEFDKSVQTTKKGIIRHPAIFIGLRKDKKAKEVVKEDEKPVETRDKVSKTQSNQTNSLPNNKKQKIVDGMPETGSWERLENRIITSKNKLVIDQHQIELINIERQLWPGITKAHLIQYYIGVADYILPALNGRPLGLNICLESPAKGGFFIRGMEGRAPKWAQVFTTLRKHKMKGKSDSIQWLLCNDKASLVYIINLESVDIHPWASRVGSPTRPDYIVIDLDPSDDDFKKVIETALVVKKVITKYKLKSFIKTSGKTGLHVLLPCADINYGTSRKIAETMCNLVHELIPDITTRNTSISGRGDRVYIDASQNDYADRIAAAYCVRAYHLPTVSTPLQWDEVQLKLNPHDFTISSIGKRLEKKGDLFKDILNAKVRAYNAEILNQFL